MKAVRNPIAAEKAELHVCGRPCVAHVYVETGMFEIKDVSALEADAEQTRTLEAISKRIAGGMTLDELERQNHMMRSTLATIRAARNAVYDASGRGYNAR